MTPSGLIHLLSAIYLSGVLSFAISLNEQQRPRAILAETGRRWLKFLIFALIIALVVHLVS